MNSRNQALLSKMDKRVNTMTKKLSYKKHVPGTKIPVKKNLKALKAMGSE